MGNVGRKSRLKRVLLWGTALLTVALLGVGVWFYSAFLGSTDAAIRHAEAFVFRRMTVTQMADQGTYRFFYVTNRRPGENDAVLKERFGRDREKRLKFGSFDADIQPTLGLGMLINPSEWFRNEEIQLTNVRTLEQAALIEELRKLVQASPHRGLLVLVHGFRTAHPAALRMTAFVGHILDINAPVLVFDWPGNQGSSPGGYRRAREVAKESGAELGDTLQLILREIQPEQLWLLGNSLGAQVVVDGLSLLYQQPDLADAETELEDVVLTAPDVDQEDFDQKFKKAITALTRNLIVYVSSNDRALLMSRIINRGQRLGESSLRADQLQLATRVVDLTETDSDLVTLVDVTPVNRTRNFHNFSLETPEFFDDLFLRLTNPETPRSRLLYQVQTPDDKVYSVLTRGR